jgi:sterol desaturase/sphingolipid hydroxylase (fatty acid hydroxylase superfamily)
MHSTLPVLLVCLVIFGILEVLYPFYTYKQNWADRVMPNLAIALFNSLLTKVPVLFLLGWVWSPQQQKIWPGLFSYLPSPLLAGVLSILMLDLFRYGWHCMAHFWPIGWRFHRVHHSDLTMNITTAYRFNGIEVMASYIPMTLMIWLFGIKPEYVFIYEVAFVAIQVFQHSNWAISPKIDRLLTYLIVTPNYHRVHHSQIVKETDSNFGSLLTIWDRVFGTYRYCSDAKKIDIGLIEYPKPLTILDMLTLPFR